MSGYAAAPNDFVDWLRSDACVSVDSDALVAREKFGRYVAERLETACVRARPHKIFERHHAKVLDIGREGERAILHLNGGTSVEAHCVVLALGNAAPRHLPFFPAGNSMIYESAWHPGALVSPPLYRPGAGLSARG
jgi:uncharacterized NAD(P)/FAD-binding protein YdhS